MYALILKGNPNHDVKGRFSTHSMRVVHGGKDVGWVNPDGTPLKAADLARLKAVGTPPGWTDVRLSTDPKSPLQVIGYDAAGREQPKYLKEFLAANQVEKFVRIKAFHKYVAVLATATDQDMLNTKLSEKERDAAAIVNICLQTAFRPDTGTDGLAKVQSYGASSLLKQHVKVKGDVISFKFVGKSGHVNEKSIEDPELAKYLRTKMRDRNSSDRLFVANAANANAYLKSKTKPDFSVKDLRTWNGTAYAKKLVKSEKMPTSQKELDAQKKRVSTLVSQHLNNTPKVALDNYIDPTVFRMMEGGGRKVKVVK